MHFRTFALDRHFVDGYAVCKELTVESKSAFVFCVQAVVIQVGKVDLGGGHFYAVQTVDEFLDEGLGRAAVKGDVVDRQVQDDAAVCNGIEGGTDRNACVQVEGLGIAVDDINDFLTAVGSGFGDLRQLIGEDSHRQTVFFAVIRGKGFVRPEYVFERLSDCLDIRSLDDGGDVQVIDGRLFVQLLL